MTRLRRLTTTLIGAATVVVAMTAVPGAALGQEQPSPPDSDGVVIDDVVIDDNEPWPTDDVVVETEEVELTPGAGPVGETWTSDAPPEGLVSRMAEFGASYARSTETLQFFYTGKAKAAANIFNGQRIIRVSIQYNRRNNQNVDQVVGARVNSNAGCSGGSFRPGPEVTTSARDSLGLNDPPTRFIYSTGRVASGQRC